MVELRPVIEALSENGVDFVIIGGVAINLHSSAYVTEDFDFCLLRERENLKRSVKAFAPFNPRLRHFPKDLPFIWDDQTLQSGTISHLKPTSAILICSVKSKALGIIPTRKENQP